MSEGRKSEGRGEKKKDRPKFLHVRETKGKKEK